MLRKLMEKENDMQDQVNKVQMETPRKKQRKSRKFPLKLSPNRNARSNRMFLGIRLRLV
jgi:hypothetical protein